MRLGSTRIVISSSTSASRWTTGDRWPHSEGRSARLRLPQAAGRRSLNAIVAESDRHAAGVCRSLRDGVLAASTDVLGALWSRTPIGRARRLDDSFEQALTIVYRMLFLLFAEARALVPLWHPVYRESYSLESLRDAAERPHARAGAVGRAARDRPPRARRLPRRRSARHAVQRPPVRAGADAAGRTPRSGRRGGAAGGAGAVDAAGGRSRGARAHRLSRPRRRAARRRLRNAARLRSRGRRPSAGADAGLATVTLRGIGVRKATGTFYTPQPIADYLVRRTLGPLVRDAAPDRILQLRIVDPGDGQRRVPRRRLPLSGRRVRAALVRDRRLPRRATSATPSAPRSGARSPSAACTASTSTRWPCSSRACRSGWRRSRPTGRSAFSITGCRSATACSARGSPACAAPPRSPRRVARGARRRDALPLFDDDAVARGAARGAAGPLLARGDAQRHARAGAREGAGVRRADRATRRAVAMEAGRRPLVRAHGLRGGRRGAVPSAFGALSDAILTGRGALPATTAERYLERGRRRRRGAPALSLGARVSRSVLRPRRQRACRGAGFDAVIGNPPWDMIRADAGAPTRARARARDIAPVLRFTRDAGVYTRSRTATPTAISCSSSARSR